LTYCCGMTPVRKYSNSACDTNTNKTITTVKHEADQLLLGGSNWDTNTCCKLSRRNEMRRDEIQKNEWNHIHLLRVRSSSPRNEQLPRYSCTTRKQASGTRHRATGTFISFSPGVSRLKAANCKLQTASCELRAVIQAAPAS